VRAHGEVSRRDAWKRAISVMQQVGIPNPDRRAHRYPFEFSGGMCQRIMIAMAISCRPSILIADEPTTALDVTVQAQVLDLLKELQDELGLAMLFITHDLGVVADVADDVAVLYAGEVVESGTAQQVFYTPQMPYTSGLLQAIPNVLSHSGTFTYITGDVPSAGVRPDGCRFAPRCSFVVEGRCDVHPIPLLSEADRLVRCVRADELDLQGVHR
jgi:peptide/nickel transport system ATP-binding protein